MYNQKTSVDSLLETTQAKSKELESAGVETRTADSPPVLLSREFEHHLILSAWSNLRDELIMRGGN